MDLSKWMSWNSIEFILYAQFDLFFFLLSFSFSGSIRKGYFKINMFKFDVCDKVYTWTYEDIEISTKFKFRCFFLEEWYI